MLQGIGVSVGIAMGNAVKFIAKPLEFSKSTANTLEYEMQRFENAVKVFSKRVSSLADEMDSTEADGQILRGYLAMINDPYLTEIVIKELNNGANAETAISGAEVPNPITTIPIMNGGTPNFCESAAAPSTNRLALQVRSHRPDTIIINETVKETSAYMITPHFLRCLPASESIFNRTAK